jgi:hypothetical protein
MKFECRPTSTHIRDRPSDGRLPPTVIFQKGSIRWHLNKGSSNARASFLPGILSTQKREIRTGDNNGMLGSF